LAAGRGGAGGVEGQQSHVQGGPGLGRAEVGAEDALDPAEPLVERGPGQVRGLGRLRLVAARSQVGGQHINEPGVGGQQRADFALHEGLQSRVVPQQVQQAAQAQVRQPVEQSGFQPGCGHVGDLAGLQE
jgi:hypothetical protein